MKNAFLFCLLIVFASACGTNEEIAPQNNLEEEAAMLGGFNSCLMSYTSDPSDGSCPSSYTFTAFPSGCSNYSWSVNGNAYFSSGTTSQSASVIVQRHMYYDRSFTVTATMNCSGTIRTCSRTFTVTRENYCI